MDSKKREIKINKNKPLVAFPIGKTFIYQPNRITNGNFIGFGAIHMKLLVVVIKSLQEAINADLRGDNWRQLNLFNSSHSGLIRITIKLGEIAKADKYEDVIQAGKDLQHLILRLRNNTEIKGNYHYTSSVLFAQFHNPIKRSGRSVVYVDILERVAKELIEIDKNSKGVPQNYTRYLYEVAMSSKSKYTAKLYMILSSWKSKGSFRISLEELRTQLGLNENTYPVYKDFKKRILIPTQKDLKNVSDCWFDCSDKDFEIRSGKKVISLYFKIISPETQSLILAKIENIKELLIRHFNFRESHLNFVNSIFENSNPEKIESICNKLTDTSDLINSQKGRTNEISDKASYMAKVLVNAFG